MIIIPDVHGRDFWKEPVASALKDTDERIVFLGDYLDPYPSEHISKEGAIDNFKLILELKLANPERIILLLGNHDFMTYIYPEMGDCRTDFQHLDEISKLYADNRDLFQIGEYTKIGGRTYTFSHGCILKEWACMVVDMYGDELVKMPDGTAENVIDSLNAAYAANSNNLLGALDFVSPYRTWYGRTPGSIVWADVREMPDDREEFPNTYEIFGHTQLAEPIITPYYADLDARAAFRLDEETGELNYFSGVR